jgi:MATE family multidrug resistance protein
MIFIRGNAFGTSIMDQSLQRVGGVTRPFDVTHRMVMLIAIPMTLAAITTPLLGLVDMGVVARWDRPS